jgi:hypothetical protein
MEYRVSTDSLPERDRFAWWADELYANTGTQRLPAAADGPMPFRATVSGRSRGPLVQITTVADNHVAIRANRDIARRP